MKVLSLFSSSMKKNDDRYLNGWIFPSPCRFSISLNFTIQSTFLQTKQHFNTNLSLIISKAFNMSILSSDNSQLHFVVKRINALKK